MCGALPPTLNGTLKYCNHMEYWNIRILGKWNIGHLGAWSQVYWYIGILVYWYIGMVYWYIGILVYCKLSLLQERFTLRTWKDLLMLWMLCGCADGKINHRVQSKQLYKYTINLLVYWYIHECMHTCLPACVHTCIHA